MGRHLRALISLALLAVACESTDEPRRERIPVGVLGDSDSHSYHDDVGYRRANGAFADVTFQWTEVLARLRSEVDLGDWDVWGSRGFIAEMRRWVGLEGRAPRKRDYEHNLAYSGAHCGDLVRGSQRQASTLARIIERNPRRWDRGLVVIRIGVNTLGQEKHLERYAAFGLDTEARRIADACAGDIETAIGLLRAANATVGVVVVGLLDNANWVRLTPRWQSRNEMARIREVLAYFNGSLSRLATRERNVVFLDDDAWWTSLFGDRDDEGVPRYRPVSLDGSASVANTQGDDPRNAVLGDGHAGTVWNGLFAANLVRIANESFGLNIRPIGHEEIARLADPEGRLGLLPARGAP